MADLVFMGTPQFAVPSLKALIAAGHRIRAVVTQPDRPAGRGKQLQAPPVKQLALEHGLPVLQPGRLRKEPEIVQALRELEPDLFCVVAFGQILPQEVLDIPKMGSLNAHGSLLPAYRGAGPIQRALIDGATETGVTTMLMDAGMDTGAMLEVEKMAILPDDDAASLGERMADVAARLLARTVDDWLAGRIEPTPQPAEGVSMAPMLKKDDGILDWRQGAKALADRVRGTTPWPGAQTLLAGQPVKILKTEIGPAGTGQEPGAVLDVLPEGWLVATGEGTLLVREVQIPGKRPQPASEAARGLRTLRPGVVLGI